MSSQSTPSSLSTISTNPLIINWKKKSRSIPRNQQDEDEPRNTSKRPRTTITDDDPTLQDLPSFLLKTTTTLNTLLEKDPILSDLSNQYHTNSTLCHLLAYESGQGILIQLKREDGSVLEIPIKKNETISGLKKRVQQETEREMMMKMAGNCKRINWKRIWKENYLVFGGAGVKLQNDGDTLYDAGLVGGGQSNFIRFEVKLREKKKSKKKN